MLKTDTLSSGINDEQLSSGINDDDNDNGFDENDDDGSEDDHEADDGQGIDDGDDDHDKSGEPINWKKKFYSTTNIQNRQISNLMKEMNQLKNSKNISDEDIAKIKEKYNEEDLDLIEKIIEKKATDLMDKRQTTSLANKEYNIFINKHPDLSDPEVRHIKSLQKDYGYSLEKAYTVLFGKNTEEKPTKRVSVSNSFGGDNGSKNNNKSNNNDDKAYSDMDAYLPR